MESGASKQSKSQSKRGGIRAKQQSEAASRQIGQGDREKVELVFCNEVEQVKGKDMN